jgi:type III pantothenate kinase
VIDSCGDLLAIEVGSSCVKLGWFPAAACTSEKAPGQLPIAAPQLPEPAELFRIEHRGRDPSAWISNVAERLDGLAIPAGTRCVMASVHQAVADALMAHTQSRFASSAVQWLTVDQIPIEVRLTEPTRVGIDRLLSALAANRLRDPQCPAIVVDMGTATTVNLISADGAFEGGAILAGPLASLRALHNSTASLPLLDRESFDQFPAVIGKSTAEAMASGAFWGAVGAVRELISQVAARCDAQPRVFLTGGASFPFAKMIGLNGQPARHVPHLVLAGIKLTADKLAST